MQYLDQLNQLLMLTNKMLEYAKSQNWDEVMQVEAEYSKLMSSMKDAGHIPQGIQIAQKIQKLIVINAELGEICSRERTSCLNQISNAKNRKKAVSAYSNY